MTVAAIMLLPSSRAPAGPRSRSPSISSSIATTTAPNGCASPRPSAPLGKAAPLGQRVIKAFADILDAPGGLLLVADENG